MITNEIIIRIASSAMNICETTQSKAAKEKIIENAIRQALQLADIKVDFK